MLNFGFVIEQALGHITHHQNLARWVEEDADICPSWMPIEGHKSDIWNRIPVIRNNWSIKCSLRTRDAIEAAVRVQPFVSGLKIRWLLTMACLPTK